MKLVIETASTIEASLAEPSGMGHSDVGKPDVLFLKFTTKGEGPSVTAWERRSKTHQAWRAINLGWEVGQHDQQERDISEKHLNHDEWRGLHRALIDVYCGLFEQKTWQTRADSSKPQKIGIFDCNGLILLNHKDWCTDRKEDWIFFSKLADSSKPQTSWCTDRKEDWIFFSKLADSSKPQTGWCTDRKLADSSKP